MQDVVSQLATAAATALDADILFLNGIIDSKSWMTLVQKVKELSLKRHNVLLMLVTPGGDPNAAFRIGRCLQSSYEDRVFTFIPGWCKSAGTLITLASKRVFIGDLGELGPLDIQLAKADELFEMSSGLSVQSALATLEQTASKMFIRLLFSIRSDTRRGITTRTAAELAAGIVGNLLEPIYRQIEPVKIGENQRAMSITKGYGTRLASRSGIFQDDKVLDFLVGSYPDHGFVIDREEAHELFTCVEEPTPELERLAEALGDQAISPRKSGTDIEFLSVMTSARDRPAKDGKEKKNAREAAQSAARAKRPNPSNVVGAAGKRVGKQVRQSARNGEAANGTAKA